MSIVSVGLADTPALAKSGSPLATAMGMIGSLFSPWTDPSPMTGTY